MKLNFKNLDNIDWITRNFINRKDALAEQTENAYVARKNLSAKDFRQLMQDLVSGRVSCAAYATDLAKKCKWMAWDFDLPSGTTEHLSIGRALRKLRTEIAKLEQVLRKYRVPYSIVFSGRRGFHVIVFFDRPVPASIAFSLLTRFQFEAKLKETKDLHIDLFPKSADPGEYGSALKIPGSIHRKTGARSGWARFSPGRLAFARAEALSQSESKSTAQDSEHTLTIKRHLEIVYAATEGNRNRELSRAAFNVGRLIGSGQVDLNLAKSRLHEAAKAIGLPRQEAQTTISSGIAKGIQKAPEIRGTTSGKPIIHLAHDEMKHADQVIAAIASRPEIFVNNNRIVRIQKGARSTHIEELPEPSLRELIADSRNFTREQDGVVRPCGPPMWLIKAIAKRGHYPSFRPLHEIVNVPILKANGDILLPDEYDQGIGILCAAGPEWKKIGNHLPKRVSRKMARVAAMRVLSLIRDFPFQEDRDRHSVLAAMLTLVMKPGRGFLSPMFAITANQPATGKTLLADVIALLSTGQDVPRMTLARDEAEVQKSITSMLVCGSNICLLDNVDTAVKSPTLNANLTGEQWSSRLLGQNQMVTAANILTWFLTGNNLKLNRETFRRTILIRLRTSLETPQHRKKFAHANLKEYIRSNQVQWLALLMTIVRGFAQAGSPKARLRVALGSFKGWDCVRHVLLWLGLPDVVEKHETETNSTDPETQDEIELIKLLARLGRPFKVDDLFRESSEEIKDPAIRDVLNRFEQRPTRNSTGRLLRKLMDRPISGFTVRRNSRQNSGFQWNIEKLDRKVV